MIESEFYRPERIVFKVSEDELVPESLGKFEKEKDLAVFLKEGTAINEAVVAVRFMDEYEKEQIRYNCMDLLENKLPSLRKDVDLANETFLKAKKELKEAEERVSATLSQLNKMIDKVKHGFKDMDLDSKFTYRFPLNGKYYFFTWIDKIFRLCKIKDIPEYEKEDLFNAMSVNKEFFEKVTKEEKKK